MEEQVILVDEQDNPIGLMPKLEAHKKAVLHRAFSVFILNAKGELMHHHQKNFLGDFSVPPNIMNNILYTSSIFDIISPSASIRSFSVFILKHKRRMLIVISDKTKYQAGTSKA